MKSSISTPSPSSYAARLRIGVGYDVHALVPGRSLILGGVAIDHLTGLLGHSDADVLTHAVCDALLSAARLGDIGQHFPDTSDDFKDANSIYLLRCVVELLHQHHFAVVDVDVVLAAQRPKLSPYRDRMRACLADALGVDVDSVGIKMTTTERLGFVGREEGMSATAVCLLERCCVDDSADAQ